MNNKEKKNNLENLIDKYYQFNIVEPFIDTSSIGLPTKMMFSCLGFISLILFIYRIVTLQIEVNDMRTFGEFLVVCCGGCCCLHPIYIIYCLYQMYNVNKGGQGNGNTQGYQNNQGYGNTQSYGNTQGYQNNRGNQNNQDYGNEYN